MLISHYYSSRNIFPEYYRFRGRYHPKDAAVRNKEMQKAVKKRVAVFLELMKSGRADSLLLDMDHSNDIVKLLDAGMLVRDCSFI